jgi:hypothetical protein
MVILPKKTSHGYSHHTAGFFYYVSNGFRSTKFNTIDIIFCCIENMWLRYWTQWLMCFIYDELSRKFQV